MTMMPRIRSVKPELFMHEGLFKLAENYKLPLQFAFIGLILCCDKEGRFCWQPRRLQASILPFHDVEMLDVRIKHEDESILPPIDDPNWVKPEPQKTHSECTEAKTDDAFLEPFLAMPPPEIENKNSFKNNELQDIKSPAPRACARRSRGTRRKEGKGRERKGRESIKQNIVASEMRPPLAEDPVRFIFEHWQRAMGHLNAQCDPKRKVLIKNALSWGYSVEALCQAITGCSLTPHNRGENDRGERYDGLHIILRNCDQIDRFINNCHYPPRIQTEANRKTQANVQSLQRWMDQKMKEEPNNANAR